MINRRTALAMLIGSLALTIPCERVAEPVAPPQPAAQSPKQNTDTASEVQALNAEGVQALAGGNAARALQSFQRAARLAPQDPRIAFNVGLVYSRLGRFAEAIAPLRHAKADPTSAEKARFLLGAAFYQTGQYAGAAAELEPLRTNPQYAEDTLYLLEESYRRLKKGPEAKRAFSDLATRYPDSALVHKLMGVALDADDQREQAIAEFKAALERDPKIPEVRFGIGLLYLKLHDQAQALKWMRAELSVSACNAPSLYYIGEMERSAGHNAAALDSYRKAVSCNPDYGDAYLGLGAALREEGRYAEAVTVLERVARLIPSKPEVHYQLGRALAKVGRAGEARDEFEKARQLQTAADADASARLRQQVPAVGTLVK